MKLEIKVTRPKTVDYLGQRKLSANRSRIFKFNGNLNLKMEKLTSSDKELIASGEKKFVDLQNQGGSRYINQIFMKSDFLVIQWRIVYN